MAKKMKKKSVHWSKLPRTKLISMVKRLELANAKLKTQLAEMRENKLLNRIETIKAASDTDGVQYEVMPNPFDSDEATLAEAFGVVHVKQQPAKMPWE